MSLTAGELAVLCGVSRGTVDRALHDKPGINPETKARILKLAAEHGYRPDYLGSSLVRGRTHTIGVVVFDLKNRYFAQLLQEIELSARRLGYAILISLTDKLVAQEIEALEQMRNRRVDGIILQPVGFGDAYEHFLAGLRTPVVTVGNRLSRRWDYVSFDNRQAAADAVRFLADRGYQHLIYLAPPLRYAGQSNISAQEERLAGAMAAAGEMGLATDVIRDQPYIEQTLALIRQANGRTAVFCSSDWYALTLYQASQHAGLKIPDDFGLMGFDRLDIFDLIKPELTSIVHPIEAIGSKSVEQVVLRIEGQARASSAAETQDAGLPVMAQAGREILLPYRIEPGSST